MPGCVSCRLYLLLDALENFDISSDLRSREISKFSNASRSKYSRQETHAVIIFSIYASILTWAFPRFFLICITDPK